MCYDGAGPDFPVEPRIQRAAKPYHCGECSLPIAAGERYEYLWGRWDGRSDTMRTCLRCAEARRWLEVVCNSWLYGSVHDDLAEHWSEGYHQLGLGRVVVAARGGGYRRSSPGPRWQDVTPEQVHAWVDDALAHTPAAHIGGTR